MFSFRRTTMLSLQFSWVSPANQSYSHLLTTVLSGFGFVLPIFWGKTFFPLLPRGGGLNTIYGRVIHLPTIHDPTFEDLVKWHALYVEELKSMFDEYKVKFGFGDRELHCFWSPRETRESTGVFAVLCRILRRKKDETTACWTGWSWLISVEPCSSMFSRMQDNSVPSSAFRIESLENHSTATAT